MSQVSREAVLTIRSYAQALFNAGKTQGVVQRLTDETKMLSQILRQNESFRIFLEGPQIATEKKIALLEAAFKDRVNPLLMNLLFMMADRERGVYLESILTEFQEIAERDRGVFPATFTSARELGFQEKLKLKAEVG